MKDATYMYLMRSTQAATVFDDRGRDYSLFGNGTEDLVINQNGVFTDIVPQYSTKQILEFKNVTIGENFTVQGNKSYGSTTGNINVPQALPFYLKVNGTLTVNGNLNMNGLGQQGYSNSGSHSSRVHYFSNNFYNLGYSFSWPSLGGQLDISVWRDLYNYGAAKSFFDGKTQLVGAGNGQRYNWKRWVRTSTRHSYSYSLLNGGGNPDGGDTSTGGGGGFLALYYENMQNSGKTWTDPFTGQTFYTNINANGGGTYTNRSYAQPIRWGGGMLIIAARNIVIGPQGSITCNPARVQDRSENIGGIIGYRGRSGRTYGSKPSGFLSGVDAPYTPIYSTYSSVDTDLNSGGLALLNRPGSGSYLVDYNFGKFTSRSTYSGGAGVCFGYQVQPGYNKPNH